VAVDPGFCAASGVLIADPLETRPGVVALALISGEPLIEGLQRQIERSSDVDASRTEDLLLEVTVRAPAPGCVIKRTTSDHFCDSVSIVAVNSAATCALAFVLIIGTPDRFARSKELSSYLGLVPTDESSGERRHLGNISKQGNTKQLPTNRALPSQ
jgi:hypothetical protein